MISRLGLMFWFLAEDIVFAQLYSQILVGFKLFCDPQNQYPTAQQHQEIFRGSCALTLCCPVKFFPIRSQIVHQPLHYTWSVNVLARFAVANKTMPHKRHYLCTMEYLPKNSGNGCCFWQKINFFSNLNHFCCIIK